MDFIATYWYVWLFVVVSSFSYAVFSQLRWMKKSANSSTLFSNNKGDFFDVFGIFFVMLIGMGGVALLIIAIVISVINYIIG